MGAAEYTAQEDEIIIRKVAEGKAQRIDMDAIFYGIAEHDFEGNRTAAGIRAHYNKFLSPNAKARRDRKAQINHIPVIKPVNVANAVGSITDLIEAKLKARDKIDDELKELKVELQKIISDKLSVIA